MSAATPPTPRRWWQLRLRTTLLIVVVAALGLNLARDLSQLPILRRRAARDNRFDRRDLVIRDPGEVAIIELISPWAVEDRWHVYLPPGGRYRLCLATRVGDSADRPSSFKSAPIEPGRHILSLDERRVGAGWRVVAAWNQAEVISVDETKTWFDHTGWSSGGTTTIGSHRPVGGRIPITHRRFFAGTPGQPWPSPGPDVEGPGLQMWIESESEGPSASGSMSGPGVTSPTKKLPRAR